MNDPLPKLEKLTKHIHHVQESVAILAKHYIVAGQANLGVALLQNAARHDNSKYSGIELRYLVLDETDNDELIRLAVDHHNKTNTHHPEAWVGGIKEMPDLFIMEMVCDWKARSTEFGTDLRGWITESATDKFGFKKGDRVFKNIQRYLKIILDTPFRQL